MYEFSTYWISFQVYSGNCELKYYACIDFISENLKITQLTSLKIIVVIDGVEIPILLYLSSLTIFPNKT